MGFTTPPATLASSPAVAAVPRPVLRIVAFGSSSTQGVGASNPSAAYPAQLEAALAGMLPKGHRVEVANRGIGGEDVDDMMRRLQADVLAGRPDIVIWQTGSNDPLRQVPLDRFEAETRDGIKAMRKAGAEVILMEPQWCPRLEATPGSDRYRATIRRIGDEMKLVVIRRAEMMKQWLADGIMSRSQMLSADGLHMSDRSYAQLAREIAPVILKAGAVAVSTVAVQPR